MHEEKEGPSTGSGRTDEREVCIRPNKHRRVQRVEAGGRRLFDEEAKREFLENFAASANVARSARESGFSPKTPYKHRMTDPRVREGWGRALEQGYARLEAELLAEALEGGPIPIDGDRDGPGRIDRELAVVLLREHKRGLAGIAKAGAPPRVASNAEVREALEKRLQAFAARTRAEGAGGTGE